MENEREDGREFKALCFLLLRYVVCCWAKTDLLRVGSGKAGSFPHRVPTKCSCSRKKKQTPNKPTQPKLIIGQAWKEGKECCLSEGRFAVGMQNDLFCHGPSQAPVLLLFCASTAQSCNVCAVWIYERNCWNKVLLCEEVSYLCSFLVTIWAIRHR